jgi:hypothetical protein
MTVTAFGGTVTMTLASDALRDAKEVMEIQADAGCLDPKPFLSSELFL